MGPVATPGIADTLVPSGVLALFRTPSPVPPLVEAPVVPEVTTPSSPVPMEAIEALEALELPDYIHWPLRFREAWAYLMTGDEASLIPGLPLTDIGYFNARITSTGRLSGVPTRANLGTLNYRVHLVLAETGNYALTHFVLDPTLPLRKQFLLDLAEAARDYDGVQIDFEAVLTEDKKHYLSFLRELKSLLGGRTLSVAIPARTRKIDEAYDYFALGKIADRVIVMAYDEHWSGGSPGSIASLSWCAKVARYAKKNIPRNKLVMGLPFYGRSWPEKRLSKAWKFSGIQRIMGEEGITSPQRHSGVPHFEYSTVVSVQVFYEDARSVLERLALYAGHQVDRVAFWCLGQEDPRIWPLLRIGSPKGRY